MRRSLLVISFLLLSVLAFSAEKEKLVVGVVYDGIMEENKQIKNLISTELNSLLGSKYEVLFPKEKELVDSFNKEDISLKIDQLLNDEEVDIVIASGILSSYVAIQKENIKKPLFAPFLINNVGIDAKEFKNSGKENLNYIVTDLNIKQEIENFKKVKKFDNMLLLVGEEMMEIIPDLANYLNQYIKANDIDFNYELIEVKEDTKNIIGKIEDAQAVVVGSLNKLAPQKLMEIIQVANKNKIASFSATGVNNLDKGILAGHSYEKELKKRIRAMAINISFYLDGEKPETLPVFFEAAKSELMINMSVVEKTGIWPSWEVLSESKLVNFATEEDSEMAIGLKEVIETAITNNPEIEALRAELKTAGLNIQKTKTNYKPDIEASIQGSMIDEDRAESMFTQPEQYAQAGITLTQVLFSEDVNMAVDIVEEQKKLKEEELKAKELDLTLETAEAYFTVLKAEAYARIQRFNLELTKSNLEIAKGRKAAGISGPADIYRWEAELANSVSSVIEAMLNVRIAKTNLKRIINYTLSEEIDIKNVTMNDSNLMTSDEKIVEYISNQNKIDALVKYMTEAAVRLSPELKQIDSGINIQERLITNTKNKRFMPTVGLSANYTLTSIVSSGAGSDDFDTSYFSYISDSVVQGIFEEIYDTLDGVDENNWTIGIGVSLPLYSGGELKADREIAEQEIVVLDEKKEATEQYLEQRVVSYVLQIVSAFSKIQNAEISANAANKALDLVKDAYSRGVVSISELMDAQTASVSAEQYRSTVMYDLMTALMRAERAVGKYYIFMDENEREKVRKDIQMISDSL